MKHALHLSRVANRWGRKLLSWCLFLGMSLLVNTVFATETEPATKATKNKEEIPHKKLAESTPNLPVAPSNAKLINSQMQTALGQINLSSRSTLKVKANSNSKVWGVDPLDGKEKILTETGGKTITTNTNISVAANKRKKISDGGNKNGPFNISQLNPNP